MMPFVTPPSILAMATFATTCDVKRSTGSGGQYGTPTVVLSDLDCSHVQEMSEEEQEKAGLTDIVRPCRMRTAIPAGDVIQEKDIVVVAGEEYLVNKATLKPSRDQASYYELIVEVKR